MADFRLELNEMNAEQCRQILAGIMGFQIGGAVGQHRVGGGMAFVEGIA